jgi:hypothetical protein
MSFFKIACPHCNSDTSITKWVLLRKRAQQNGKKGGRPHCKETKLDPRRIPRSKPTGNPVGCGLPLGPDLLPFISQAGVL